MEEDKGTKCLATKITYELSDPKQPTQNASEKQKEKYEVWYLHLTVNFNGQSPLL